MLYFALPDQILHGSRHIFDGHVQIDAMLVEQIDCVNPEPPERRLGHLADMLRPAVQRVPPSGVLRCRFPAKFRGNHHLPAEGSQCFSCQLFVRERTVDLGGVKKCDSSLYGRPDQTDRRLLLGRRPKTEAQSHAAQAQSRNLETTLPQHALLHTVSSHLKVPGFVLQVLSRFCRFLPNPVGSGSVCRSSAPAVVPGRHLCPSHHGCGSLLR